MSIRNAKRYQLKSLIWVISMNNLLNPVKLSPSGRPELFKHEIELMIVPPTTKLLLLENNVASTEILSSIALVVLTNCRIILIARDTAETTGMCIYLKDVLRVYDNYRIFSTSSRININVRSRDSESVSVSLKFSYDSKEFKSDFLSMLLSTVDKRSWENISMTYETSSTAFKPSDTPSHASEFSVNNAGISGILRKQERDMATVDVLRREALSDLDGLIKRSNDVVSIINKYSLYLEQKSIRASRNEVGASNDFNDTDSLTSKEINEMEEIFQTIGKLHTISRLFD